MLTLVVSAALFVSHVDAHLEQSIDLLDGLDQTTVSVDARSEPLERVLATLGRQLGAPVRADWDALEFYGYEPDSPVTFEVRDVTGSAALAGLADTLGDPTDRPIIDAYGGQLLLTSPNTATRRQFTDHYDVRDLLSNPALIQSMQNPTTPADPEDDEEAEIAAPATPGEELLWLLTDHVDPDAWTNFGGERATISDRDGVLLVTAPAATHRQIRQALGLIRAAFPSNLEVFITIQDVPRDTARQLRDGLPAGSDVLLDALRRAPGARTVWTSSAGAALTETFSIEAASDDTSFRFEFVGRFESARGQLGLDVQATARRGSDTRTARTALRLARGEAGVIELSGASGGETARLILLEPRLR